MPDELLSSRNAIVTINSLPEPSRVESPAVPPEAQADLDPMHGEFTIRGHFLDVPRSC